MCLGYSSNEEREMMYQELIARLRACADTYDLEAADAIEQLLRENATMREALEKIDGTGSSTV